MAAVVQTAGGVAVFNPETIQLTSAVKHNVKACVVVSGRGVDKLYYVFGIRGFKSFNKVRNNRRCGSVPCGNSKSGTAAGVSASCFASRKQAES